jgi:hypothetical protein
MANCVETAKKIRAGLKEKFPHTKFSVRSKSYSMGSSVDVSWTDFPTPSMVNEYLEQFEEVRRDAYGEILSGGNMFISGQNTWTPETRAMIEQRMKEKYSEEMLNDYYWKNKAFTETANEIYNEMYNNKNNKKENEKGVNNTSTDNETVTATYTLNDEHNGIEISFSGKPASGTIELLKENGFRWHSKKFVWYAKQSPERLIFAEALCSTLNDEEQEQTAQEEETTITAQVEQNESVHESNITELKQGNGEKIKVKEIIFEWSESAEIEDGLTVSTFAEADQIIRKIAYHAPDNGAYDKTAFKLVFEDGQTYSGRYDVQYKDRINGSLSKHVKDFVRFSAGLEKPSHMSQRDWENLIRDSKADWLEFYNNYLLEDITQPEPEPEQETEQEEETANNSKVIDFTQFKNNKMTNNSSGKASGDKLTPEQEFKKMILIELFGEDNFNKGMDAFGNIDELFKISAEVAITLKKAKEI